MQEQWSDICIQHICCITLQVHIIEHLTPPQPQGTTLVRIQEGEVYDDLGWQCHWFNNKHLIQLKNSVASFIEKLFWFFIFRCGLRQGRTFCIWNQSQRYFSLRGISPEAILKILRQPLLPNSLSAVSVHRLFNLLPKVPSLCILLVHQLTKVERVQRWKLNNK